MTVLSRHLEGLGQWVQIEARSGEDASNRTVESAAASSSGTTKSGMFKMSVPVIVGMVCVALILIGLGVLIWRWRVRVREHARMNRSYEKYGVGRGIESSNSHSTGGSTSKSSKADPYGSFFEVETEKPKKALLNFRRSSTATSGATPHHGTGWNPPSSWQRQIPPSTSAGPAHPPGLSGGGRRTPNSFSFSLRKPEEKKAAAKTHHAQNSIKSKGISAPLIVVNGGPEPIWSPLPSTSTFGFGTSSIPVDQPKVSSNSSSGVPQSHVPPPATTTNTNTTTSSGSGPSNAPNLSTPGPHSSSTPQKPKFKQPQPRSPPATPGTSQKADLLAVSRDSQPLSGGSLLPASDGSLYSRNSFSSSNHDILGLAGATLPASPLSERRSLDSPSRSTGRERRREGDGLEVLPPPPPPPGISGGSGSGISGTVKSSPLLQQRGNKSGSGNVKGHSASPSSSSSSAYGQGSSPFRTRGGGAGVSASSPAGSSAPACRGGAYGNGQSQSHNQYHQSQLPRLMTVIAPFTPTMEDELPLKVGDTVRIIEEYRDAWCLVQLVGRIDSPRGVVPCVCLQERKRIIPVPMNVG